MIVHLITKAKVVNIPLIIEEFITAQGANGAVTCADYLDDTTTKIAFLCTADSSVTLGDCQNIYDAHVGTNKTVAQEIDEQLASAQSSAKDALYKWRDKTPAAMWALATAEKLADLEGDTPTLETGANAVAYWNSKILEEKEQDKLYADTGTTSYRDAAVSIHSNRDRAFFNTVLLVSEWKADGNQE